MIEPICMIYTTFATQDDAMTALQKLIKEKLATCGNISLPHTAVYPWKGKVAHESEVAVYIKAPEENQDALIARLQAIHPYELPCILVIEAGATADYAQWLANP